VAGHRAGLNHDLGLTREDTAKALAPMTEDELREWGID
jgi:hypothetical protein